MGSLAWLTGSRECRAQLDYATRLAPYASRGMPLFGRPSAEAQTPHPAIVRVISPERNGASLGSGTLVDVSDRHGLVITNWHVVKDAAGNVIVSFADGFQSPGYVIKMDRDWDLAAVAIWKPTVQPVAISSEVPRPGDMLTICGYGSDHYLAQTGRFVQYLSPAQGWPADIVEMSAAARHGDSGGPMLNARGELAGVLFGEGGGATSGSHCGRVRMFLASITGPAFANRPSDFVAKRNNGKSPVGPSSEPITNSAPSYPSTGAPPPRLANQPVMEPRSTSSASPVVRTPVDLPTTRIPTTAAVNGGVSPLNHSPIQAARAPTEPGVVMPPSLTSPEFDSPPQPVLQQLGWEDIAGHTLGDQIKTVLAGIGAILLFYQVIRKVA